MRLGLPFARRPLDTIGERRLPISRILVPTVVLLAYLAWPYVTLWRLDRALARNDPAVLAHLVDLDAVREEIRRKLNKEEASSIGPVSDDFIHWIEHAIRRNGAGAIEQQVSLDWVQARLLSRSPPGKGFAGALSRAFFDDPIHFSLRIGAPAESPVYARLSLQKTGWKMTAVYF